MGSILCKSCVGKTDAKSTNHYSYPRRKVKMCDKASQVNMTQLNDNLVEIRDHRPAPLLPSIDRDKSFDHHYEIEPPIISHQCHCCNRYDVGLFTFIPASCEHHTHVFRI